MRTRYLQIFTLFFILLPAQLAFTQENAVNQEDCPDNDLSSRFGAIRDQGNAGQCFAFVAADLIGFNQGVKPPDMVSALDVGINYLTIEPKKLYDEVHKINDWQLSRILSLQTIPNIEKQRKQSITFGLINSVDQGGGLALAIGAYNKQGGICLEKNLPSQAPSVDLAKDQYIKNKLRGEISVKGYYSLVPAGASLPRSAADEPFYRICNGVSNVLGENNTFLQSFDKKVLTNLQADVAKDCAPRIPMAPMKYDEYDDYPSKDSSIAKLIAYELKKDKNIPMAIAYDPSFLTNGRQTPFQQADHGSTIVGSRWNTTTKTCEFKLRNSWGTNCKIYAPEFRDSCEKESGYIWITTDDLNTHANSIIGIGPKK